MSKTFFKNTVKVCFIIFVAILISCSNFTMPKKRRTEIRSRFRRYYGANLLKHCAGCYLLPALSKAYYKGGCRRCG